MGGTLKNIVIFSKKAEKSLRKSPPQVQQKTAFWRKLVETQGLSRAVLIKGFNDEGLKGDRQGQRSIRLNHQWRAIYEKRIGQDGSETVELVEIIEVTPHKY